MGGRDCTDGDRGGGRASVVALRAPGSGGRVASRAAPGRRKRAMSERNEELMRRAVDEVWNGGRTEVIDEMFGPGDVRHDPALPQPVSGARGFEDVVRMYRTAFPDLNLVIEEMLSTDDVVVARWRAAGTHRGDLMGLAPTGKRA